MLYAALQTWSAPLKADVSIARDPFHVLEILAAGPSGFRVVLHASEDDNISDIDQLSLADNLIEVILSYNLGLTARPDLALISGQQNRPPLLDHITALRSFILSLRFPTEQTGSYAVYRGRRPYVTPDGIPLAAYTLTFKLQSAVTVDQPLPLST